MSRTSFNGVGLSPGSTVAQPLHGVLVRRESSVEKVRSRRGRTFVVSDPFPDRTSLEPLDNAGLQLQALGGIQPWSTVHKAMNGANHDYVFNHTEGSDTYRGAKADLLFASGPLDWDGAINLYQFLSYAVRNGGVVDFAHEQQKTQATINKIILASGIPSEIVWSFYQNFDRIARESGNATLMNPELTKIQSTKPESSITPNFWPYIIAGIVGLGITAYIVKSA